MSRPENGRGGGRLNRKNYPVLISTFIDTLFVVPLVCLLALASFWNATTVLIYYPDPDLTGKTFLEALYLLFLTGESNVFDELYIAILISGIYSFMVLGWMIKQRKKGAIQPPLPANIRWAGRGGAALFLTFIALIVLTDILNGEIQHYFNENGLDSTLTVAKALTIVALGSILIQYVFSLVVVRVAFVIGAEYTDKQNETKITDGQSSGKAESSKRKSR